MTTIFKKALVLFALVAVALVGAVAVAPAEAQAATGSFTIQSKNAEFAGKTVTAYQMFTVENPVVVNDKATTAIYTEMIVGRVGSTFGAGLYVPNQN